MFDGLETNHDHLWLVRLLASDCYQTKIVRLLLMVTLLIHSIVTVMELYYCLFIFNSLDLINYGATFFGVLYGILGISTLFIRGRVVEDSRRKIAIWSCGDGDEDIEREMRKESLIASVFTVANLIGAFVSGITYTLPVEDDEHIFFAYRLFKEWFPHHGFVNWVYRSTFCLLAYGMSVHGLQVLYLCQQSKFQLRLCLQRVKNLSENYERFDGDELLHDQDYQRKIADRLSFCIKRHCELCQWCQLKELDTLIVAFAILGCLEGISVVFFLFGFQGNLSGTYKRVISLGVCVCMTFVCVIISGQSIEDETLKFLPTLYGTKWHTWNSSNRKTLLIFMINCMEPCNFKFSKNFTVNYQLGMGMVRVVYSMLSVLMNKQSVFRDRAVMWTSEE